MRCVTVKAARGGRVAEKMTFTKQLFVCPCMYGLAASVRDNISPVHCFADKDPNLSVKGKVRQAAGHADLAALAASARPLVFFSLPENLIDTPMPNPNPRFEPSTEVRLQHRLEAAQRRLVVCCCAARTGRPPSHDANLAADAAQVGDNDTIQHPAAVACGTADSSAAGGGGTGGGNISDPGDAAASSAANAAVAEGGGAVG